MSRAKHYTEIHSLEFTPPEMEDVEVIVRGSDRFEPKIYGMLQNYRDNFPDNQEFMTKARELYSKNYLVVSQGRELGKEEMAVFSDAFEEHIQYLINTVKRGSNKKDAATRLLRMYGMVWQ